MRDRACPRPSLRRALVLPLLLGVLSAPAAATAVGPTSAELERELDEAAQRRDRLEQDLAGVTGDLDLVELELARIGSRLDDARARLHVAEGQVALGVAALEEAETDRDAKATVHDRSEAALAALDEELAQETDVFSEQVVHTFKYGTVGANQGSMMVETLRRVEDPAAFAVVMHQLQTLVEDQTAVVSNVQTLRGDRAARAEDAARARGHASQAITDAAEVLGTVEELRDVAAGVAAEVEREEDQQRVLLASLQLSESEAADLVQRAAIRQTQIEAQLRDVRAEERRIAAQRAAEAAEREAAQQAARQSARRTSSPTSGDGGGPVIDGMVCPVVGAVAGRDFSNDWGFPRSGGRTHQGNDMFARRGTDVVAVADGEVVRWNPPSAPTRLGGITVTYRTADGSEWYNAHLDTIASGIAPGAAVSRGQVIGTVGNTGNAISTPPHLHLGRRYGGSWTNPWPTTSGICR